MKKALIISALVVGGLVSMLIYAALTFIVAIATGGGGGGRGYNTMTSGKGGSGIVIIRNARG